MSAVSLMQVSPRRRRTERAMRVVLLAMTLVALVPLVLVVFYLVKRGAGALSWSFFSTDPTGSFLGDPGGIKSAILGTLEIVALATLIAVPVGIAVALYLVEYARGRTFGNVVRYLVDVLTGVPSIVFGLFVYIVLVTSTIFGRGYAGWKGAVALALLMLPVVVRASEVVLLLVPDSLREAALALGAPRWKVALRVVLPSAASGLLTGALLAIARAAGETAPLLFTSAYVLGTSFNLDARMNSLPLQIFSDVGQAQDRLVTRAWGAALTLVALILLLTIVARLSQRRSRIA